MKYAIIILLPFALLGWALLVGFVGLCAWLWPEEVIAAEHRVNELGLRH
jgi:hypothetical protein